MICALLVVITILAIAVFTGKFIHAGMTDDEADDFMFEDEDPDLGDKS